MAGAVLIDSKQGWRFAGRWLLLLLGVIVAILFVQAVSYWGLMRWVAEWQFARFGRYFPVLTIILLAGIVAALWWAIGRVRRRVMRKEPERTIPWLAYLWLGAGKFLAITAAAFLLLGIGVAVHYFRAPDDSGPLRVVDLSRPQGIALVPGPTRLDGIRAIGPIGLYTEDLLFSARTYHFAPADRATNGALNLFVEVDGPDGRQVPQSATGLLRANALPSEIAELYRLNRIPVAATSTVLFRSERTANRPILILLGEAIVFALLAAVFAVLCRRKARKIERETETPGQPATV